jgi:7-carboxy-7-deazaguanine synthase
MEATYLSEQPSVTATPTLESSSTPTATPPSTAATILERLQVEQVGSALSANQKEAPSQNQSTLPVLEIFGPTVQGEGPVAGKPCIFIRLAICDYRCEWCDTKESWTAARAKRMSFEDIAVQVSRLSSTIPLITISGGNPCVHPHVGKMVKEIQKLLPDVKFSVETQGSIWQDWVRTMAYCVVSPKGPSSGQVDKLRLGVLDKFMRTPRHPFLKVVVFTKMDYDWAKFIHMRYPLIPFYVSTGTNEPYTGVEDLGVRYRDVAELVAVDPDMQDTIVLPQLHKVAWGAEKGR